MKKTMKTKKAVFFIVFTVYILVVLNITVVRLNFRYDERQLNLALFVDLINVYRTVGVGAFLRLFIGNIGWFVPFGFLLPILLKKESFLKIMVMGFAFSFMIEVLQYIFRKGVAELDDLILNVLGAAVGYFLYKISTNFIV
ncbi:MAG: VanZ family protein [Peptococcaceae bacterium]|jgi:glycopeptide antibiotics resistance protein|nr:VanZ family protein [Peptococcaceae bacterium]